MKPQRLHFGLLMGGAVAVILWLLYEEQQKAAAAPDAGYDLAPPPGTGIAAGPVYPNIPQIVPQNFDVSGAAPNAIPNVPQGGYVPPQYNIQMPASATPGGGCSCEEDSCDSAGQPVSSQLIPGWVINQGASQVANFGQRVTFGIA
jgi:hypothetical protein